MDVRRSGAALPNWSQQSVGSLLHHGHLYIAMAGHHQIWLMDLAKHTIVPFAGTHDENLVDGPRLAVASLSRAA